MRKLLFCKSLLSDFLRRHNHYIFYSFTFFHVHPLLELDMNIKNNSSPFSLHKHKSQPLFFSVVIFLFWIAFGSSKAIGATSLLADQPIRATTAISANVMLALSVEWPTGVVQAYNDEATGGCPGRDAKSDSICYFPTKTYIGYFDPLKCYAYTAANRFEPTTVNSSTSDSCGGTAWSGNYLNWATMQTTDEFRWAMTGGDRFLDTSTLTVLEKARHDGQGGFAQFPIKRVGGANVGTAPNLVVPVSPGRVVPDAVASGTSTELFTRITGLNTVMWVSRNRTILTDNNHPNGNNPLNTLDLPPTVNFTELGNCIDYIAAGGTGLCTLLSSDAGLRQIVTPIILPENGQCPSATAGTCANATAPFAGTRIIVRDENGTCPAAGAAACTQQTVGTKVYNITEAGQCNPPTPAPGNSYGSCSNTTSPTRRVIRNESGTCAAASSGFVACTDIPGTRRYTVTEPGICSALPSPGPGVTFGTCTNIATPLPAKRSYTRTENGQCPAPTPPSGTTYSGCSNPTAPRRDVTRDENGSCPVSGAVCSSLLPGTRSYNVTNAGQCPAAIVTGVTVNSCTNQSSPTRRVTINQSGQCPATGTVSCTNDLPSTIGTRTITTTVTTIEEGQCPSPTAGACTNTAGPAANDQRRVTGATTNAAQTPKLAAFYVRAKVCDQVSFPESETKCVAYSNGGSTSYKPEGLIQENALRIRFGAFGYLNDSNQFRDGGVLRARMKDVGPLKPVPGSLPVTNSATEWSSTDGTYVNNPDATDASATGLGASNSGVTQYLNKFGRAAGYKGFDPYSELYAEVLKYFKAKTPTPSYSSGINAAMVDGFPVITNWNDPIQYACQKNFIVGIADSNTHKDKNLNGGISSAENEPAAAGGIDTDYDVAALTNTVGNLETPAIANLANYRNCCNGSAYLAGLAYYAHTTDLRSDFSNQPNGKQTISSYFVDVRESGSWGTTGNPRNQLWLASKFGGFKYSQAENADNAPVAFNNSRLWANAAAGLVQGYGVPNNYFAANQPDKLVNGLRAAFNDINSQLASAAGGNLASTDVSILSANNAFYKVQYNTSPWSGNVQGIVLTAITAGGEFTQSIKWDADAKLDALAAGTGFDSARVIVTAVPGASPLGQPFRLGNLSAAQKLALGTATEQQDVLNYLRGDRSKETLKADGTINTGGLYRTRAKLLGDIVDSEAVYVGPPVEAYDDALNPGYSVFATAQLGRRALLYVGANDGMLHAFDARTDGNALGGKEVFAFIPSFVYDGPNASPATDGLRSLANDPLNHRFFVNRTPRTRDIDFDKAGTATGSGTSDWRTILVGGLGKGGKGFYALDITDPANFTSEAGAAAKVLWEFTDPDMGFSYGIPVITKTRKWGWVVMLSSGYNNVTGPTAANRGRGYLFVVNPKTGALIKKVKLDVGDATNPSGFAQITSYVPAETSGVVDEVYGGDLLGNVWRIDFKSATADPTAIVFATLKDGIANNPQPITTAPVVDFSPNDKKRYVFVGTGRYLDSSDSLNTQQQTFYALRDGSGDARFEDTATPTAGFSLPTGASFPIDRSQLANNSDLIAGLTPAQIEAKPMGWYYDLTGSTGGTPNARERITVDARTDSFGVITWAGTTPKTDACNPNGVSSLYSTNFGSGKTQLYTKDASGIITAVDKITTAEIVKLQIVNNDGNKQILASGLDNPFAPAPPTLGYDAGRFTNWREILQ
jgi:type IV pilus assembly protein PilY1